MAEQSVSIIIDCPYCEQRVQASCPAEHWRWQQLEYRIAIVQCSRCFNWLVARQNFLGPIGPYEQEEYSEAQRLWPSPRVTLSLQIPEIIRTSLDEAQRCLDCGSYTASVAMTGRVLESICQHYNTREGNLFNGLKELQEREIIDKRLYQWADELRTHRNLAAHASGTNFGRRDAGDIFDFAVAICEYVFVLTQGFEEFSKRIRASQEENSRSR